MGTTESSRHGSGIRLGTMEVVNEENVGVPVIDVEKVGRVVVAGADIQVPVAIDIDHERAGTPGTPAANARDRGHVLEPKIPRLAVEPVRHDQPSTSSTILE